jgi:sulfur carrier protein
MIVSVNGERRELRDGVTVAALVADIVGKAAGMPDGRGVAVAVDAEVVPRSAWDEVELVDGQRVEILAAIQGG